MPWSNKKPDQVRRRNTRDTALESVDYNAAASASARADSSPEGACTLHI